MKNVKEMFEAVMKTVETAKNNSETIEVYQAWVNALMATDADEAKTDKDVLSNAKEYASWNGRLEQSRTEGVGAHGYAQIGNEGANIKEFDVTNGTVVAQNSANFEDLTFRPYNDAKGVMVTVPHSMYAEYVKYMSVQGYSESEVYAGRTEEGVNLEGRGIASGVVDSKKMDELKEGATMPIFYWEMEEHEVEYVEKDGSIIDGTATLTGKYFTNQDDLVEGKTYFIGYAFKRQANHYHIDGYIFTYNGKEFVPVVEDTTKPEPSKTPEASPEATPTASPEAIPEASPEATPTVSPEATPEASPEVTPEATPEATPGAIPEETQDDETDIAESEEAPVEETMERQVLGASRVTMEEAAVAGAQRGIEAAVLGKRRRPQTGDDMELLIWVLIMSMTVGTIITSGVMMVNGQREKK